MLYKDGKAVQIDRTVHTDKIKSIEQMREVLEFPAPHCSMGKVRIFSIEQRARIKQ